MRGAGISTFDLWLEQFPSAEESPRKNGWSRNDRQFKLEFFDGLRVTAWITYQALSRDPDHDRAMKAFMESRP